MHNIYDGVYVEETDGMRKYVIDAEFSPHIKSLTSHESQQEIELRKSAPTHKILRLLISRSFHARLDEHGLIHVATENPVKLVMLLCEQNYILIEQATAIITHEIAHIKNPVLEKIAQGKLRVREIREIVIQNRASAIKYGYNATNITNMSEHSRGK